jgi:uncharacterized repeat protein (TIGR03803 family)
MTRTLSIAIATAATLIANTAANASTFQMLHPFAGAPSEGSYPIRALTAHAGKIYGSTCHGGANSAGTVFKINPAGTGFITMHHLSNGPDGVCPSELTFHQGKFWGTTVDGGGAGVIFSVNPNNPFAWQDLWSFGSTAADGQIPRAGVIFHNNAMFGTTAFGNALNEGTVFRFVNPNELPVHSFNTANPNEGSDPEERLVYANGALYGTTKTGGSSLNFGTVFKMSLNGIILWQYSFAGSTDGATPSSPLLLSGNTLYGLTRAGGTGSNNGTLYKLDISTPTPAESVVASFTGGLADGAQPSGDLSLVGGLLYGTTEAGGTNSAGTIFAVDPVGMTEFMLHPLDPNTDGGTPMSGLVANQTWFYGTASTGNGTLTNGTVFRFQP